MPAEQVAAIEQQALDQARSDVYGADWRDRVNASGEIEECGIGSTRWLLTASEGQAERHYAAIGRFIGPAAEKAERERIARLRGNRK